MSASTNATPSSKQQQQPPYPTQHLQPACPHGSNPTALFRTALPSILHDTMMSIPSTPNGITDPDQLYHPPFHHTTSSLDRLQTARDPSHFILGTRKSALAHVQTELVSSTLSSLHPSKSFSMTSMSTIGDQNQTTPLHLLTPYSQQQPAKSLWTDELEARLEGGAFDLLVHSLKDVPTSLKEGCEVGCMLEREDPRDCLVVKAGKDYVRLEDLPEGSVVGTGSTRRVAMLKRAFPGLRFEDMRGNLNTRLRKLDDPSSPFSALILATSGLTRLNMAHRITSPLSSPTLYHAVGQGALGVEIRSGDKRVIQALRGLGHWQTEWRCGAERGCLRVLEGGCSVPVGVESHLEELPSTDTEPPLPEEAEDWLSDQTIAEITLSSPLLWFSGILPLSTPISSPMPKVYPRRARLHLSICVTSLDGSKQVVCAPRPVIVKTYQQAERWGEICAQSVKQSGGRGILEEVAAVRRERERKDLERALAKSRAEVDGSVDGGGGGLGGESGGRLGERGSHEGLKGLVRSLIEAEGR